MWVAVPTNATQTWVEIPYMFFGATAFSSTTFAGVGIQNVVVLPNGKRVNIAIGNTAVGFNYHSSCNRQADLTLQLVPLDVISWNRYRSKRNRDMGSYRPIEPVGEIMASSTSSDLKLELITTGEKSGTWGTITNTNLQILEQAASGYISLAVASSDVALSLSNHAVANGKNLYFKLTGTLTANRTVTMPDSAERVFIVEDATARSSSQLHTNS